MGAQLFINGLVAGSGLGLLAASFALIYQTAGFFHFAHASVYTVGAYLAYASTRSLGLPLPVALACAVVITALIGWAHYTAVYSPILRKRGSPTDLLLASLGLMVALQNGVAMTFGDELKILWDRPVTQGFQIGGVLITGVQITIILVSAGSLLGLASLLKYTRWGLLLRAVANDPALASAYGLEPRRVTGAAFAIGSGLAAVAAILAALDTGLRPSMGFNALLMAVVAVIVGGAGSIPGAILGGLGIGLMQHLAAAVIPTIWVDPIVFVLLVGFLVIRPRGVFGASIAR